MELKNFLSSINYDKKPLLDTEDSDPKKYTPFVVNRCLSYFTDTIFYANEMNCNPWLDPKAQFDFHRLGIRKKKRFSSWIKKEDEANLSLVKQAYGYTDAKAREVLNILQPQDLEKLKVVLNTGGVNND
jgi:hypothetical protein